MTQLPNALWLSVSPSLRRFDQRLIHQLTRQAAVRCWEYLQTEDEPCCLDVAVTLLHDYLKHCDRPVHLLGHGISGVIGLLYARSHPNRVKSLTLLSVGANPAVTWHAHYYGLRQLLPCSRTVILGQMARLMFGPQSSGVTTALVNALEQELDRGFAPHSLVYQTAIAPGGIEAPLLICQGAHDVIVDANQQGQWQHWLKPSDCLWQCPESKHFFHYDYPQRVAETISSYWRSSSSAVHSSTCIGLP
ncbi:MAG: alpha/beta hydrolase [Leptolyngbyaceae cyanobacterium SM1_1_3]|nr:alpha/beta hydrolase [Leptolyngbyaceae cyanobacterium SM1_1_3]NJN03466.1 alpha/beta hydrolase [Leptolyngbyaceae cyanobacterium RM1_1_2]